MSEISVHQGSGVLVSSNGTKVSKSENLVPKCDRFHHDRIRSYDKNRTKGLSYK